MQQNILGTYSEFKNEVTEIRDEIFGSLVPGTREEEIYKGTIILFSNIHYRPKFMFVGINPGAGFYNSTGIKKRDNELDPDSGFEYILAEGNYDYRLAKQTRDVFRDSGLWEYLEEAVKTNLFYTCTSNTRELHEFNRIIFKKLGIDLVALSKYWTMKLINLINPQVIICEGKAVVDKLSEFYSSPTSWDNNVCSFEIDNGRPVIGYNRCFSNIRGKDSLKTVLSKYG